MEEEKKPKRPRIGVGFGGSISKTGEQHYEKVEYPDYSSQSRPLHRSYTPRTQNYSSHSDDAQHYRRPDDAETLINKATSEEGDTSSANQSAQSQNKYQPRQSGYQPRQGGYRQNGYQPRQGGYQRPDGYQPRQGGYQRPDGYQPRQGGYQRQDGYQPRQGGYRQNGYQPRQGGYQRQDGYQPRQGGYQRQDGYQPHQGGYQRQDGYQPRQGGYRQNGYQPRQGGYQRPDGYQYRQGGYQQRPGFLKPIKKNFIARPKQIDYVIDIDPNEELRLNKYMANAGICSRREADEYITKGLIKVNGNVVTELGTKISRSDVVEYDGKVVTPERKCYILLNKPKDCVTTTDDPNGRKTVMDIVKNACTERIYPVGRLDRNTTGVLLLTNDGELSSKLTHPKFVKKKIYHVWTDKDITEEDMQRIADGIELPDGEIHADAISYVSDEARNQAGIEIHSGRNRIVRRIFESLGYHVVKLDRVYFAGLTKKNLPRGRWRYLTQEEVNYLRMGSFE